MSAPKGITTKELAERLGCSPQAVNKAARNGRITKRPDGTFDPLTVLAEWERNSKLPTHGGPRVSTGLVPVRAPAPAAVAAPEPEPEGDSAGEVLPPAAPAPHGATPPAPTKPKGRRAAPPTTPGDLDEVPPIVVSNARKAHYDAELQRVKLEREAGRLVEAAVVSRVWFGILRIARDAFRGVPDRLAHELAAEQNPRRVHELLLAEVDRTLDTVATDVHALHFAQEDASA